MQFRDCIDCNFAYHIYMLNDSKVLDLESFDDGQLSAIFEKSPFPQANTLDTSSDQFDGSDFKLVYKFDQDFF